MTSFTQSFQTPGSSQSDQWLQRLHLGRGEFAGQADEAASRGAWRAWRRGEAVEACGAQLHHRDGHRQGGRDRGADEAAQRRQYLDLQEGRGEDP